MDVPATRDVYLDEPWLAIWWDRSCNCVHVEWKAFATSAELRAGMLRGLDAIKDKRATAYVSDTRKIKVIVQKDQQWIRETWIPLAVAEGLLRIGLVTGKAGLGKTTVLEVVKDVNDEAFLRTFDSIADAFTWVGKPPS